MASLLTLLLNPKNLLIAALSVALAGTWFAYDAKKHAAITCQGKLEAAEKDVAVYRAELGEANGIIEALKKNIAGIRKQLDQWKRIAADAEEFSARLLAAAESKKDCEVYHAENARLVDDFVDGFNSGVRRKIDRTGSPGDRAAEKVVPAPGSAGAPAGNQ